MFGNLVLTGLTLCLASAISAPAMAQEAFDSAPESAVEMGAPMASEPGLELLYRSVVTLGPAIQVGQTALGMRRIIPITGGTFEGPDIKGEILPMGWDWQLDRPDGCTEIIADYFLRTDDGVVINVINSGALCQGEENGPIPARTSPVFEVPLGKYEHLAKGGYIGTLGFDPTSQVPAVVITIYRAN